MPDGPSPKAKAEAPPRGASGSAAALQAWVRALSAIKVMEGAPELTLPGMLDDLAEKHGDSPALLGEGEILGYRDLAAQANRIARWAKAEGIGAGDAVALLMPNCPSYVATWLGLTRAGCAAALINTNLVAESLAHSIRAASATRIIVDASLLPALAAIIDQLPPETRFWIHGAADSQWPRFETAIAHQDGAPLSSVELPKPQARDLALLIYTSGTTGLPKAARVTHDRIVEWSFWFAGMMDAKPEDRLYDCLPLYHSTGGVVAVGAMLVRGASVKIAARFSASRFWDDVVEGGCTVFQYIGELCRYLAASPPHPRERDHKLRLACGNGMQGDVWTGFVERFGIPRVLEFYAATEGSVSLYNCEGKPGAIGRVPPFLAQRFPIALIRVDAETGVPERDAQGRCIPCGADETGEALGQVLHDANAPARQFDGYTNAEASERKLLRDVLKPGDCWFRTGDLMKKDAAGYFYFVDRIGDTFRWKGENVSTGEVAAVLRAGPGVTDTTVYSVSIKGQEGRAGMAAITVDASFDLTAFWAHIEARLPAYAQPLFLRLGQGLDLTGTFKLMKGRLATEGYRDSDDPVWFNDRASGQFVSCDGDLIQAIESGAKRC